MPELRSEPRDPIRRKAQLNLDGAWVPCLIQDMSTSGFGIMSTRPFTIGQVCALRCEPFPGQEFHCDVEVRHYDEAEAHMGVRIRAMNEAGRRLCMQLMQDYHSDRKMRNQ
jgi:hypothetical protein